MTKITDLMLNEIVKTLTLRRKDLGLSFNDVAKKIGLKHRSSVQKYEAKITPVSIDVLQAWANALGLEISISIRKK